MFGFLRKAKAAKELDAVIAEINRNMENNYKDAAQEGLREFEVRLAALTEQGELGAAQQSDYAAKLASYKERLKAYSHKDQKPYWAKE